MYFKKWELRGVQLDLARQMETMDYIFSFVDFIQSFNYNVLVLYLEGRIKTPSFSNPSDVESYSLEEMREIVSYAKERGIEVLPVISNLGHAELFLRHSQLASLAELRGGVSGRFTYHDKKPFKNTFCPSLEGTYDFFQNYLREVSEVFPFDYFHLGNDEVWDIGFCDLCQKRASSEGQEGIFVEHLNNTYDLVANKLGKKMIIWDDMFEQYPIALKKINKNIILCCWQYSSRVDLIKGHFFNQPREDRFSLYDKLGFSYLFATAGRTLMNNVEFAAYASKYNALGGIVTNWEKESSFLYESYPVIARTGNLLAGIEIQSPENKRICYEKLFGQEYSKLAKTIGTIENMQPLRLELISNYFYVSPTSFSINERMNLNRHLLEELTTQPENMLNCDGKAIVEDLIVRLRSENLALRLLQLLPEVYGRINNLYYGKAEDLIPEIDACLVEAEDLRIMRKEQWKQHRHNLLSTQINKRWNQFKDTIIKLREAALGGYSNKTGMLIVNYFLPDIFSAPMVKIRLLYEGETEWEEIDYGIFKPIILGEDVRDNSSYYSIAYLIDSNKPILEFKIESWGYGRQGLTFIEAVNKTGHFVPNLIQEIEGSVEDPFYVLTNDLRWSFIGHKDTGMVFLNPVLAKVKHSLVIRFKKL